MQAWPHFFFNATIWENYNSCILSRLDIFWGWNCLKQSSLVSSQWSHPGLPFVRALKPLIAASFVHSLIVTSQWCLVVELDKIFSPLEPNSPHQHSHKLWYVFFRRRNNISPKIWADHCATIIRPILFTVSFSGLLFLHYMNFSTCHPINGR